MPACAKCGVNMAVAERTLHHDGKTVGNFHTQCSYLDWLVANPPAVAITPSLVQQQNRLNAKQAGNPTHWP